MNRILIKSAVFTGLFLGVLLSASLAYFSLSPVWPAFAGQGPGRDLFRRLLRDYDNFPVPGPESRQPDRLDSLDRMLDNLEKNARGVEAWLSVLKRRRELAFRSPRFLPGYREAAGRAVAAFPWSQPIAALSTETLLYKTAPEPEDDDLLKNYVSLMTEARFSSLVLAVRVLGGELETPAKARVLGSGLLARSLPLIRETLTEDEGERLGADLGLLLLLEGDYAGASGRIRGLSAENRSPVLRRLAAEYFYDSGEPLRAAEIFYQLGGEEGMLRSADALWLGGRRDAARNLWQIIAAGNEPAGRLRSLYNLAASAADREEAARWLSALRLTGAAGPAPGLLYSLGIIRYTRLMEPEQAAGILEDGELREDPLAGLELLRRQSEVRPVERTVAETWLLLGRHPAEDRLYQWGAWYFNFQRKYQEIGVLVKTAGRHGIGGPWLDLNAALPLMREGKLGQAEELLRASREGGFWQSSANLGRILESRHAPQAALEQYDTAASLVNDPAAASRIQFRRAGCFKALGRTEESRRALRRSLELNPRNLSARLELQNLEP
jgi:tetratricopeptide (TPR) repeat protein